MVKPEDAARQRIDQALELAGWAVQDAKSANIYASTGVAIREFLLNSGHGNADYLLYVNGEAVGVVEAKKEGETLTGVEVQSEKYSVGLPDHVPAPIQPLPFLFQSTGTETRFTSLLDPKPRSREVFSFHRPETFAEWLSPDPNSTGAKPTDPKCRALRAKLQQLPPLDATGLWAAQATAIRNLEQSLAENRPRALIQMATGSGKTYTAVSSIYRLVKFGGGRRVLFLVDRAHLGDQALKEFQQFQTPDDRRKFTELYNVQLLRSNWVDPAARVVITTVQRLYSILQGDEDLPPEAEEGSLFDTAITGLRTQPIEVAYNPRFPIEMFDVIFVDECHRSIYNVWRQVLEYFDAFLVGLTATPGKQTLGFFNQNLVMEYGFEQAVADRVNVDFDVYRIRTRITERGATVDAGEWVDKRHRMSRKRRWEQLDDALTYSASALDRDVVAMDQIRTVIRTFRDKVCSEIFPGRTMVPKTLIFAKDDSHAEDIVQAVREEFAEGNEFCEKITYRTSTLRVVTKVPQPDGTEVDQVTYKSSGLKPEDLLSSFRNSYNPRIVVTVDMIATGTDVKPLEVVMFMRSVRSRTFFEQMKGRGVRVIDPNDLQAVTRDARAKTHFVIVDCVGVTETELVDTRPLDKQPNVPLEKLLQHVGQGGTSPEVLSTLASRLARLDKQLDESKRASLKTTAKGTALNDIVAGLIDALDPDRQIDAARQAAGLPADVEPTKLQLDAAARALLKQAAAPLVSNPDLRKELILARQQLEQTIDRVTQDVLLAAGHSAEARERAKSITASWEQYIAENKDELTALQVLYSQPYRRRPQFGEIKALAQAIALPPRAWTPELLWRAYETLDKSKVRGSGRRVITDIVSLVRFALQQDDELIPFPDQVCQRFYDWLVQQKGLGRTFTPEQLRWLELIRDHVAANLGIERDDFEYAPFIEHGGLGKVYQLFGDQLNLLLDELNEVLAA